MVTTIKLNSLSSPGQLSYINPDGQYRIGIRVNVNSESKFNVVALYVVYACREHGINNLRHLRVCHIQRKPAYLQNKIKTLCFKHNTVFKDVKLHASITLSLRVPCKSWEFVPVQPCGVDVHHCFRSLPSCHIKHVVSSHSNLSYRLYMHRSVWLDNVETRL